MTIKICNWELWINAPLQEWNEELAYLAQYRAASCQARQDEERSSISTSFDYIGENMAATYASGYNGAVNYTRLIGQQWYGEKRFYSYYAAACLDEDGNLNEDGGFETCGRYTQVYIMENLVLFFFQSGIILYHTAGVGQVLCSRLWVLPLSGTWRSRGL